MIVKYNLNPGCKIGLNKLTNSKNDRQGQETSKSNTNLNLLPQAYLNKITFCGGLNKGQESADVFINKFLKTENPMDSARLFMKRYPELNWLTGSVNATPEGVAKSSKSVSEALFGKQHIEFDRTLTGIESLKWVLKGDYEQFTKCQNNAVKLTRENFEHLRKYTQQVLPEPEDIDTMIGYTVINDLGKIQSVVSRDLAK